jgi:TonB family protein
MTDWKDDIEKYKNGQLTASEMHALEKRSLQDSFLADALEGADSISAAEFSADVKDLERKINATKKNNNWIWPFRIAASLILAIGTYWMVTQFTEQAKPETLALKKDSKEVQPLSQKLSDSISVDDQTTTSNKNKSKQELAVLSKPTVTSRPQLAAPITKEKKQPALLDNPINVVADQQKGADSKAALVETELTQEPERAIGKMEAASAKRMSNVAGLSTAQKIVSGKVVAADDGSPIAGVNVAVSGTASGTVTDAEGNYQLATVDSNPELVFSFIGFQTKKLTVKEKNENVKLDQDVSQLSEVVIVGSARMEDLDATPIIKRAEPLGGIKAYDAYLENNLRYPASALARNVKGKVAVRFTVRTDGQLGEFKIVKSLGDDCDREMLRLVKDGPRWTPGTVDNLPVENEVLVRLKFDPAKARK